MIKNIIATSLVAATLVFSGCGSDEGEEALSIQQQLDKRDFIGAINALEGISDTDGEKMQLGAAYMGAAGLSTTDLVRIMSESTDDTVDSTVNVSPAPSRVSSATTDSSAFARFADVLQRLADENPKMLEYLNKATETFGKVSSREDSQSLGFAIGLANTAKATTTLTYLGDINAIVDGGVTGDLTASACAISYMYAGVESSKCQCTISEIATDARPFDILKITLLDDNSTTIGTYLRLVSGVPGQYTGTDNNGEMYIHKDYIDSEGEITTDANDGLNIPVAVLIDGKPITIKDTLVDALNEGFDTIIAYAPEDSKADILEYRDEIDLDKDGLVESSEIAKYLEAELAKN